jgi:hypothetical protein
LFEPEKTLLRKFKECSRLKIQNSDWRPAMLAPATIAMLSYLLGSVPFSIPVSEVWRGLDITVIPLKRMPDEEARPEYGSQLFCRPFLQEKKYSCLSMAFTAKRLELFVWCS